VGAAPRARFCANHNPSRTGCGSYTTMVFELLALDFNSPINKFLVHCRAVRVLGGTAPGWLVRQGLMSSPPRRV
jgi:hypothetical protein